MRPSEPLERFARQEGSAVVVDRRRGSLDEVAAAIGLSLDICWSDKAGEAAEHPVWIGLLVPRGQTGGNDLPKFVDTASGRYVRLVDRFFVHQTPGPEIAAALFNTIAGLYDRVTQPEINKQMARTLVRAVVTGRTEKRLRVLDFGCGTGIAYVVCHEDPNCTRRVELIGTDLSAAMRELATKRGQQTLSLDEWRTRPQQWLDGAIAVFVLHYGVPVEDLRVLAEQLKPAARFAANFFKPAEGAVDALISALAQSGLTLEDRYELHATHGQNEVLVFEKESERSR